MKKFLFFILALNVLGATAYSQDIENVEEERLTLSHRVEFGLYYMHSKSNNRIKASDYKNTWNGVGIYTSKEIFYKSKMNFFFDFGLDIGWFDDVIMLNIPVAFNFGYRIFDIPQRDSYFMLHVGLGYFYSSIRRYKDGYLGGYELFDDEHLEQHSAFVPIGIRFYYKSFFADFTYRLRFAKSKVRIEGNSADDYYIYEDLLDIDWLPSKRYNTNNQTNRIKNIDAFTWCITIGFKL